MIARRLPGLPHESAVQLATGWLVRSWMDWFQTLMLRVNVTPYRAQDLRLTGQSAAIPTTAIPMGALPAGLYRIGYALRITRAASTSSACALTVGWTDDAVVCTQAFASLTGNTTATTQNGTMLVRCAQESPLTYAVTYASVGATTMQFALDMIVESIPSRST